MQVKNAVNSNHEAEVSVLQPVAHVDRTVLLGPALVERCESFPNVISDDGCSALSAFLETPASLRLVRVNIIEEVSLEDGVVSFEVCLLDFVLNISEVAVEGQVEALTGFKAHESFVSLHFVL